MTARGKGVAALSLLFLSGALLAPPQAPAADAGIHPLLSVGEEYNDNVLDTPHDRRSDFVTRVQPGIAGSYRAPSLEGVFSYSFDYQQYARNTREDEKNHFLNLRGEAELVEHFLYLEVKDELSRVSLDVARDLAAESLHANQTDRNRGSISPYFLWRLGERGSLRTGYRFTDTTYWGEGIGKREHKGYADLALAPLERLGVSGGYAFQSVKTDLVDYDQHDLSGGFRYEYAENSFFYGGLGNSWQSFSDGRELSNLFWHAGASRSYARVVATLEARVRYADDPLTASTRETIYLARLEKALQQGVTGISGSYSRFKDNGSGGRDRRKKELGGFVRRQLTPRTTASLSLAADRTDDPLEDYPYHVNAGAGAAWSFNYDVTASLNYSYIEYRRELDSAANARQTNRLMLTLRKLF